MPEFTTEATPDPAELRLPEQTQEESDSGDTDAEQRETEVSNRRDFPGVLEA
ncbi:hypothetical protein [Nocardia sp. NPDC002869]|uniref:hypothetical protein n=1 Tax=Nocardia sp. NPDC002869 TaxID=3161032 RepID=UPI00398CBB27